jgi:hypothetical protein
MSLLSYAAYQTTAYTENLLLVGLEYGLVLSMLLWESTHSSRIMAPLHK